MYWSDEAPLFGGIQKAPPNVQARCSNGWCHVKFTPACGIYENSPRRPIALLMRYDLTRIPWTNCRMYWINKMRFKQWRT